MVVNSRARFILPWVAVLLAFCLAACGSSGGGGSAPSGVSSAAYPVTIGSVTIHAKPTSIVSLSPTATEMLFAMGAGGQITAVDKYSDYPPNAPKKDLDGIQLNVEAITAYKPDLVITQNPSPADAKLKTLGIPVVSEPAVATLDEAYAQFLQLGRASGHEGEAQAAVTNLKKQISDIVTAAPKNARPATSYYELDPTLYSETSSTFVGEIFKLFGLSSIADAAKGAAGGNGSPQLNNEYILKSDPDYIFLADTVCCQQSAATVARRPGWAGMNAIKARRVASINDDIASRWGPRIVTLVQTIADELRTHPVPSS